MALELSRERPGRGLLIMHNQNDKFRTEGAVVRFIVPADSEKAQRFLAMNMLLTESCAGYPDKQLLVKKVMGLYGSSLNSFSYTSGNYQVLVFTISSIADRFAFGGEEITAELAEILLGCIFEPDIKDGRFNEASFSSVKHDVISKIKSRSGNRHAFAVKRATETAFGGEALSVDVLGTLEQAENLTNEMLVESYHEMLREAFVMISFCGGGSASKAEEIITRRFVEFSRERDYNGPELEKLAAVSAPRPEPLYITERNEQSQSKLVMIFKYDCPDEFALKLGIGLYGGTSFSKLFLNVREKMSLCYYCDASKLSGKPGVIVDSGVGSGNEQKAADEILRQLELLKQGEFTDEELENTKRYFLGNMRSVYDFADNLNTWFFRRFERGDMLTPEAASEMISGVTRERVIEALRTLVLDTVYFYEPTEEKVEGMGGDGE